ncbi:hypothetical protein T552_02355 [Pneumocystis carinii B80]|uniref:Calcineurin subunit B n=1 Tax=Pneumocystis carinii (strain B80) TaxID=1408658 RepID=A0A0W4ZG79_PNEC8|nr:hypothetical protein T552_02355 [Pneumocystis carinii B80]KTW27376.1 hypothetical protein T552_02355 [Pneumocystis carinii B80]
MGYKNSKLVDALSNSSHCKFQYLNFHRLIIIYSVNQKEINRIRECFMKLDVNHSGFINVQEFLSIPQIAKNPLSKRLFAVVDEDGDGNMDFEELIKSLNIFSGKGHKRDKLLFTFKIYDIDRDGYISNGELFLVLKMMTGNNLKDLHLQQIVDKTIIYADQDKDGKISFEEFTQMIINTVHYSIFYQFSIDR